jgi:hypothetical protein
MPEQVSAERSFEIGLVLAGSVSAGAYAAGVLDFLIQALEAWQDGKDEQARFAPPHNAKIKVISGASAGGMAAAMLASLVNRDLKPVTQVPPPGGGQANKLYQAWVEHADMLPMLECADLQSPQDRLRSLLNTQVFDEMAGYVAQDDGKFKHRPYFDKSLHVLLSVTNLRGIPYHIGWQSEIRSGQELASHMDHLHFTVSNTPPASGEAIWLDPYDRAAPNWQRLREAAQATSAFPLGLPARWLRRKPSEYSKRGWRVPLTPDTLINGRHQCNLEIEAPPRWPPEYGDDSGGDLEFLCMDGGVMPNDPLELARRLLAGAAQWNPRDGRRASRALIMIDPFPAPILPAPGERMDDSLGAVLGLWLGSLLNQARFRPDELQLALHDEIYSRFLLAPTRLRRVNELAATPVLAGGTLWGFGGFLWKGFREHDFQLGRRNCQRFLSRYFVLPEKNPLFTDWTPQMRERYRIPDRRGGVFLPIIPLMDSLREEIRPLPWPHMPAERLAVLSRAIQQRSDHIFRHLLPDQGLRGQLLRGLALLGWRMGLRRSVVNRLMARLTNELARAGLL